MRTPGWTEVKRVATSKVDAAQKELLSCPLDQVERVRGRIEGLMSILRLEQGEPDATPGMPFFDNPSGDGG